MRFRIFSDFQAVLLLVFLFGAALSNANAGAWAQPKGSGLAITTYRFYGTGDNFNSRGERVSYGNDGYFSKNQINVYAEYGLLDRLTIFGNFFYDFVNYNDNFSSQSNNGFPYQELGVRYQFFDEPAMSFQVLAGIPTSGGSRQPALSNNQFDYEFAYYIGGNYKIFGYDAFWDIGVGYRLRTGAPSDEFRWYMTTGVKFNEYWEAFFQAEGIHGLGNNQRQFVGNNVLLTTDFQLIKLRMSVVYNINKSWSLQAGPVLHVWGNNVGAGGGAEVSVWYKW